MGRDELTDAAYFFKSSFSKNHCYVMLNLSYTMPVIFPSICQQMDPDAHPEILYEISRDDYTLEIRLFHLGRDEATLLEWISQGKIRNERFREATLADLRAAYTASYERKDLQSFMVLLNGAPVLQIDISPTENAQSGQSFDLSLIGPVKLDIDDCKMALLFAVIYFLQHAHVGTLLTWLYPTDGTWDMIIQGSGFSPREVVFRNGHLVALYELKDKQEGKGSSWQAPPLSLT